MGDAAAVQQFRIEVQTGWNRRPRSTEGMDLGTGAISFPTAASRGSGS